MRRIFLTIIFTCINLILHAQHVVTGTISESAGEQLTGVSVYEKGTTNGTISDIDGNYSLSVSNKNAVIVFSYIGYFSEELPVGGKSVIDITLREDITTLQEMVVIGYGTLSKRDVTGSISSVKKEDIQNISVSSIEGALQGRAAGVQFTASSGELGGGVSIRVRGPSSINAGNQPLFIVDGVPISQENVGAGGLGVGASPGQTPLLNINPNDIESVEILKDAAASAMYGARAANGVVLITTKRGQSGETSVSLGYYAGFQNETNRYDMLNGPQYAQMFNDAGVNFVERFGYVGLLNSAGFPGNARDLWFNDDAMALLFATGTSIQDPENQTSTDWLDLTHQTGFVQEYNLGISGGGEKTRFYLGGTYRDEEGYLVTNKLNRFSLRANVDHQINDKLGMEVLFNPSRVVVNRISQGGSGISPIFWAGTYYPNVEPFDENGNINESISPNRLASLGFSRNPVASVTNSDVQNINTRLLSGINFVFKPLKGLTIRAENAIDFFDRTDSFKFPVTTLNGAGTNGTTTKSNQQILNWNLNYTANFRKRFNQHQIDVLLGTSFQEVSSRVLSATNNDFVTTDLLELSSAGGVPIANGSEDGFAFNSYFSRLGYSLAGKYLLTLNARYDGSSRFGKDNRFGFFPGVSAGWIISEETFLSDSKLINFLKLRASYGETGNASGIGNFSSIGLVSTGANYNFTPGLLPLQLANPDLQWETTRQVDIGINFELLKNRIRGSFGYYQKNTVDMLLNTPLPATSGFSSINQNIGEMRNSGLELDLNFDLISGQKFKWTANFNIATLKNEVLKLPGGNDIILGRWIVREGESLGSWYLVDYAGVDRETGNALYNDLNGEPGAWDPNNRQIAGSPLPDYFGGFNNQFTYGAFDLNIFFQFSQGSEVFVQDLIIQGSGFSSGNFNHQADQFNYWTPDNQDTDIPAPVLFGNNGSQTSTRFLQDASYIRLKTVSIGYTIPNSILKKAELRVFAQAQNLLTITDFKGLDPEVSALGAGTFLQGDSFYTAPLPKTITFGFNMNF